MVRKKPQVSAGSRLSKPHRSAGNLKLKPKATKSRSRGKGKRRRNGGHGQLSMLLDITLDVFFEVVIHLRPVDLLQLCRVSKHFRRTFMNESTRSIWAATRLNTSPLPTPDPLLGMSEPKLAALLFEHDCFSCGANNASKVYFALGVRFCTTCAQLNTRVEHTRRRRRNRDLAASDLEPRLVSMESDCRVLVSEYDKVARQHREIIESADHEQALDEFIEQRLKHVATNANFTLAIYKWNEDSQRLQKQATMEACEKRKATIRGKLFAMGYTENDFPSPRCCFPENDIWHSIVTDPRELTPRAWKVAKRKLVNVLRKFKLWDESRKFAARRWSREDELSKFYEEWAGKLDTEDGPYPLFRELWSSPDLCTVVKAQDGRVPIDQEWFDKVAVPSMQRYKPSTRAALIDAVRSETSRNASVVPHSVDDKSEDILQYATSLFVNPHRTDYEFPNRIPDLTPFGFRELLVDLHGMYKRRYGGNRKVVYSVAAEADTAREVLKMFGLPENTRYEDVDGRIICLCHKMTFPQPASFSSLVKHISDEKRVQHHIHRLISSNRREGGSSDIADTTYFDDHNFESSEKFLRLLDKDDTYVPEVATADPEEDKSRGRCKSCVRLQAFSNIVVSELVPLAELKRHVLAKHRREFSDNDVIKVAVRA